MSWLNSDGDFQRNLLICKMLKQEKLCLRLMTSYFDKISVRKSATVEIIVHVIVKEKLNINGYH